VPIAIGRGSWSPANLSAYGIGFGWRGHELVVAVTGARRLDQIASWRPSAARMLVRKLRLPLGMTLVVGEYG